MCSTINTGEEKSEVPGHSSLLARRRKRDKEGSYLLENAPKDAATFSTTKRPKAQSKSKRKHGNDGPSGGVEALIPSLIGLCILVGAVMAKMGFRGRASVAGIDLGTTNSVICVQAPSKGVGVIDCIPDPTTNSSVIPSVVSFLDAPRKTSKKETSALLPHPASVVVGQAAKKRIDSHPHHTFYHAKRVLGRPVQDPVIQQINQEVAFDITTNEDDGVIFSVPQSDHSTLSISPSQVGSYVVHHLMQITSTFLGHANVRSAVICVPAKFTAAQREATVEAFRGAGVKVTRILEEPTAAALAYGLHQKEGVDYILVYDFGGGTLDVSLLHVTEGFADVIGSDGDDLLGGANFDASIATYLMEAYGSAVMDVQKALGLLSLEEDGLACDMIAPLCTRSSFHTIGEQLKINLSDYPDGLGVVHADCLYPTNTNPKSLADFCTSLTPRKLSLSSETFDRAVQSLYNRSIIPVRRLLKELDLDPTDIDEVVMVGGTTRMPQIRKLVKEEMKVESLNTHIDPDLTVAYGAASVID